MNAGSEARYQAISEITRRSPRRVEPISDDKGRALRISEYFGVNCLDLGKLKEKMPKESYRRLVATAQSGRLDADIAEAVAQAVKEWAMEKGATHYCHWFQPQTGLTAEKHDVLLNFQDGKPIEAFSGSQLIQSEPDASSFPSGGMRTTFEARGYTAWDPSSPIFIMEGTNSKTLCIPSVFISYHGDALDEKTGLLRSMQAISAQACELLRLIGETQVQRVTPTLGAEQEYFLIDRAFYSLRPDLVMTGRTLLGGQPPKGQQMEDHYFGSIPTRALAFMSEMETELYKLGVSVKTRHNEVAPSQFESAPLFAEANVATDHNQLTMEVIRKVAQRHGYEALFHEKPYAGVNGSGKHNNWSLQLTSEQGTENLLDPGKTPHNNLRFLLFLAATLRGVYKYGGLLRAGVASAGNDHRLGANEAPPAIISVFLGQQLSEIVQKIIDGTQLAGSPEAAVIQLGVSSLPTVLKDNTDRNRTSPFAFTGNKFEFRAVGGSASTAMPVTFLNAAVADGIFELSQMLQEKLRAKKQLDQAILEVVRESFKFSKSIQFEGNNYSEEWIKEAEKRGLPNLRKTPAALREIKQEKIKTLFERLKIFTSAETESRYHIRLERYIKTLQIEVETLMSLIDTYVLPAAFEFHSRLSQGVASAKAAGLKAPQMETLNKLGDWIASLQGQRTQLETAVLKANGAANDETKAEVLSTEVSLCMQEARDTCDKLEGLLPDSEWPLPKYREILFLA